MKRFVRRPSSIVALLMMGACHSADTPHPANVGSAPPASSDSTLANAVPGVPPPGVVPPPGSPYGPSDLPPQREVEFRAIGQENDWILEIDQQWIMFVINYGQDRVMARVTEPEPGPGIGGFTFRGHSNEGRTIEVIWEGRPCSDVASGQPNQNTVTVLLDGVEYRGCGLRRTTTSEPKNR